MSKRWLTPGIAVFAILVVINVHAEDREERRRLGPQTLNGTYVFSGRVLLNPPVAPTPPENPPRVLIDCFSVGEIRFDGRGGMRRRVEIRCPTTQSLLSAGLGAPVPLGEPSPQQLDVIGSSLVTRGRYALGAGGGGEFSDAGEFRLGPVAGNPTSGAGRIVVSRVRGGVARQVHLLIDHQSLVPPGGQISVNSDIGASFVAYRR